MNHDIVIKNFINFLTENRGKLSEWTWKDVYHQFPLPEGGFLSKAEVKAYIKAHDIKVTDDLMRIIKLKPVRTISGVTPVTIFTKPYICSGKCIFCPTRKNAPKSYLTDEPGIQRAVSQNYDPYDQVHTRLCALKVNGHDTSKVEVIVSGGTWDDYPVKYQLHYVAEVFRALNEFDDEQNYFAHDENLSVSNADWRENRIISKICRVSHKVKQSTTTESVSRLLDTDLNVDIAALKKLQDINSQSSTRCIGMSIETRPDKISLDSVKRYRQLGVTKVQLGIQTLDDKILNLNCRGHGLKDTYDAIELLRVNGFKIQGHWMCNLFGGSIENDYEDFIELFSDPRVCPDELKIYPCSILHGTKLHKLYKSGEFFPYSEDELIGLLARCKTKVPRYCRISRLFRDIPSYNIKAGVNKTNLRQLVKSYMKENLLKCRCIRCHEIKEEMIDDYNDVRLERIVYTTSVSTEYFLYFEYRDKIVAFLRLSLLGANHENIINIKAIIRELHVYGTALKLGESKSGATQHMGFGERLLDEGCSIAKESCFDKIAVISAVGTREYYEKRGFTIENQYGYGIKSL